MLQRFFTSERNVIIAVTINAIVIFLLYFPTLSSNRLLLSLDYLLILFFLIEAVLKIKTFTARGYFASPWNRFDFVVLLISLPTLLELLQPFPNTSMVLLLRLFRLARLLRFFKFIPHISRTIAGVGRAMKASLFILVALFFLNFVLALFTCHFFGSALPEYFGNPLIASFSIFQIFTVEGWNEIPNAMATATSNPLIEGFARFYFVLVVLIGGVFGMSLANAIFVDEMTSDNTKELEAKVDVLNAQIQELKNLISNRP